MTKYQTTKAKTSITLLYVKRGQEGLEVNNVIAGLDEYLLYSLVLQIVKSQDQEQISTPGQKKII